MNDRLSGTYGKAGSDVGSEKPVDVQLALISHTNNGKTTLTRTLLGADVGEVRDAAHVTLLSEAHTLLTSPAGDRLQLWDTPGFGDSVRLLKRLGSSDNPIGWFLREVLDRFRDRPFWLAQQALRTARDAADVVLYLVNASESPQDAGYLHAEMQILAWLGKPVMVLLNQVGPPRPASVEDAERGEWREALAPYPLVRQVLSLDAFARCWVHERVFYDALGSQLPADKQAGHARLAAVWSTNNAARFRQAMQQTAELLAVSAAERETVEADSPGLARSALQAIGIGKGEQQRRHDKAMQILVERLNRRIADTTVALLALHKLDPGEAHRINARLRENFTVRAPIDKAQAGLLGAVLSGAGTGLGADLMAGGLTAGLGALLGGIVGAFTFAGAAWGFNSSTDRQVPSMAFTDPFLRSMTVSSVLRYLAVIHFGRGRGQFVEGEAPAFWQEHVEDAVNEQEDALERVWQSLRAGAGAGTDAAPGATEGRSRLLQVVTAITLQTLARLYPGTPIMMADENINDTIDDRS